MPGNETRICYRCLLKDLSEKDYQENIEKYIKALKESDRCSDKEYEDRLYVCRACELLHQGTCNACGCYVELRAAGKMAHCPKKKW